MVMGCRVQSKRRAGHHHHARKRPSATVIVRSAPAFFDAGLARRARGSELNTWEATNNRLNISLLRLCTKTPQSRALENTGPERTLSDYFTGVLVEAPPHNPRKQREIPPTAGSGERFRKGKWRMEPGQRRTFSGA